MSKLSWAPPRAVFIAIFLLPWTATAQNNLTAKPSDREQPPVPVEKLAGGDGPQAGSNPGNETASSKAISLNNAAVALARINSNQEAIDKFKGAIELDPKLSAAYLNLSIVYDRMNRIPEALSAARSALELDPQNLNARRELCELRVLSKQVDEARACYDEMKKAGPLDEQSVQNYVLLLLKVGDLAAARDAIDIAIRRAPFDPSLLNGLGLLRYKERKFDEAAAAFKQATEIDPEMDEARYNLALAQLAKSNRAGALSQYRLLEESNSDLAGNLYKLLYKDRVLYVGNREK